MRIYVSHSIRGKYGQDATLAQMTENCDVITKVVVQLRRIFPNIDFYLPAESEPFVGKTSTLGYLTEKQILEIDCMILRECDAVIISVPEGDELQGGRKIEYNDAIAHNKSVLVFKNLFEAVIWIVVKGIDGLNSYSFEQRWPEVMGPAGPTDLTWQEKNSANYIYQKLNDTELREFIDKHSDNKENKKEV